MFKRLEKRIKKREEDRSLGIDDETREALYLNAMDSDDSEESDVFDEDDSEEFDRQDEDESEEWGGLGNEESGVGEGSDHMEDDSMDEHDLDANKKRQVSFQAFTVDQALKEPIYAHPSQSKASLCALCPGKLLIGPVTITQHQASKAHARRSKRISELAALAENKDRDFSDILREMDDGKPRIEKQGESKRAEKREAKRKERKEREKTKKEKQDAEEKGANGKELTRQDHTALSDTKKLQSDGKHKAKSAESTSTTPVRDKQQTKKGSGEKTQPSVSNLNDQAKKRKRKPEREKEQELADKTRLPPSKKHKTSADSAASSGGKTVITQQIRDIAKSATKRAHQALGKANKSNGGNLKIKGEKKKKSG